VRPSGVIAIAGLLATCAFAFVASWEGVYIAGVRPRFVLLILALLLLFAARIGEALPHMPWWNTAFISSVVLVTVLNVLWPTSQDYLDQRNSLSLFAQGLDSGLSDLGAAGRILLTIVGVPLIVVICSGFYRRAPYWIAVSYLAGTAISAMVAYTDYVGWTTLAETITGIGVQDDRSPGLAAHPVILTFGTVYATAIAAWLFTTGRRHDRVLGAVILPALLLGTYASRTRGGAICVVLAIVVCVLILPKFRRHLHLAVLGAAIGYTLLFAVFPQAGHSLLTTLRLIGDPGTEQSNADRIAVMEQGLADFAHSPIYGIGPHVINQAHNAYVQAMAAGGLILLLGVLCMQIGALVSALRLMRTEPLAAALVATMLTRLVYDFIEGPLIIPVVYLPVALIAGLVAQQRLAAEHGPPLVTVERSPGEVGTAGPERLRRRAARKYERVTPDRDRR
jgi:O-antigen ligase